MIDTSSHLKSTLQTILTRLSLKRTRTGYTSCMAFSFTLEICMAATILLSSNPTGIRGGWSSTMTELLPWPTKKFLRKIMVERLWMVFCRHHNGIKCELWNGLPMLTCWYTFGRLLLMKSLHPSRRTTHPLTSVSVCPFHITHWY